MTVIGLLPVTLIIMLHHNYVNKCRLHMVYRTAELRISGEDLLMNKECTYSHHQSSKFGSAILSQVTLQVQISKG